MTGFPSITTLLLFGTLAAQAASPSPEALKFFESKVRPVLAGQCQECHGEKKHKGNLRLDNLAYILQGGESGPALVAGNAGKSLIIKAVSYTDKDLKMPPEDKMSEADIATLKQWIAMGAPWPEAEVAGAKLPHKPGQITEEDRRWWAFQKVVEPTVPEVRGAEKVGVPDSRARGAEKAEVRSAEYVVHSPEALKQGTASSSSASSSDAPHSNDNKQTTPGNPRAAFNTLRNPIDNFIQAKLAENGLSPSPEATPAELVRRVTFDLTGLPPTPERVAQFEAECKAEVGLEQSAIHNSKSAIAPKSAYDRLVDELLASPSYGERWAQHWLDLVRYAESDGYRQDAYRPNAWPYRDYVISAFNNDKPYGEFMREQVAGDEISPDDPKVTIATAYLRHTIYEYNERDAEAQWGSILNEITDVTGDVFLGLSMQCAHCHDHKFDPILQKDYYRLQSFFGNITWREDKLLATDEERRKYEQQLAAYKETVKVPQKVIDDIVEPRIAKMQEHSMSIFPDEVVAMYRKPKEQRTPWEEQVVELAWRQAEYDRVKFKEEKLKEPTLSQLNNARAEVAKFDSQKPVPPPAALIVGETGTVGATTKFKTRKVGEVQVKPGFLTLLDPSDAVIPEPSASATTTGRRTVLANWLASPQNPLTWRVMVNRVWQFHFGKGLNAMASDFGRLGEKPSHPELLDWLTSQFIKSGGKLKDLHRLMVTSAAYRQSARCAPNSPALLKDPDNRLLWRASPRRLDAEQARDAVLAATGELTERPGGEGLSPVLPCRAIYTKRIRNTQDSFLASLDQPPGFQSIPQRQATTTATQGLLMVNGEWPIDRSRAMAARLMKIRPMTDASLVKTAYGLVYSREPAEAELKGAVNFLRAQRLQLRKEAPPPPPVPSPLADSAKFFGNGNPSKTTRTLLMQPGTPNERLRVNTGGRIEPQQFSVEAVVYLKSLHPDATVRTIVSRWNNKKDERGWSFGVTGMKSGFKPNNLIMQLMGEDFQGSPSYEAVASGLRIELNRPYYVAASVDIHPGPGQQFGGNVTFYARDLSDPAAPMQSVTVPDQIPGEYVNEERALYVGGRDQDKKSIWDGAIARVVVRSGALEPGALMTWAGAGTADGTCVADINADQATSMLAAPANERWVWETSVAPVKGGSKGPFDPNKEAIADLCHALINSNEFFYLQ